MKKLPFDIKKTLSREFSVNKDQIDSENRTVSLAFSSEEAVLRYFGYEVLDHNASSVDLERLRTAAPLLVNHDFDKQVGVVEEVVVGSDRIGRATVRFGKSAFAEEIFQDIVDGIRQKVSVGYAVLDGVVESKKRDGQDVVRITKWQPFEISIVSVPADNSVGVGRSADEDNEEHIQQIKQKTKVRKMDNVDNKAIDSVEKIDVSAITAAAEASASQRALRRIQDIEKIAAMFNGREDVQTLSRKFISEGKTPEEFRQEVLAQVSQASRAVPTAEIGLSEKEKDKFRVTRLLAAQLFPNDAKLQKAAGFEIEACRAAQQKYEGQGQHVSGIVLPHDIMFSDRYIQLGKRDLTVGSAANGGYTVGTELQGASFIELLRNRTILDRLGVTFLSGLVGNISIPRQTGSATAYSVAEAAAATESQQTFDQVTFSPKNVSAYTEYSRNLLLQSSIDIENFVRMDLAKTVALKVDYLGLYGSGSSNEPQGLKNITGINTSDFAANAPTFAEVVGLETLVAADNADIGTLAYALSATGRGNLKTTEKFSSTGMTIWEQGNTVNGYRAEVSNQIATHDYFFGNWADLIVAMWGGLDIIVNPYSQDKEGVVRVVLHQSMDINARHPESFARGNNTL